MKKEKMQWFEKVAILLLLVFSVNIFITIFSSFNRFGKTSAYLKQEGSMIGIIQIAGHKFKVRQEIGGEMQDITDTGITFNQRYFATDTIYNYNIEVYNGEVGSNKYLRWKWVTTIDGEEVNLNKFFKPSVVDGLGVTLETFAYLDKDYYYYANDSYEALILGGEKSINILSTIQFKGEYDPINKTYGSILDEYFSGSSFNITLKVDSADAPWIIEPPEVVIKISEKENIKINVSEPVKYTMPTNNLPEATAEIDGTTYYFQGWQKNDGTIIKPGQTITMDSYDVYTPFYSEDPEFTGLVFTQSGNTFSVAGSDNTITDLVIPELKEGQLVNTVKAQGFYNYAELTTVSLGSTITTIGDHAFRECSTLTSITMPNSLISIGLAAFYGCSKLENITIPDSVTHIDAAAFYGCSSLTSITISKNIKNLGMNAFTDCKSLVSIEIPNSITSLEEQIFMGCSNLATVTLPNSITSINRSAFNGCSSLTTINIPENVTTIGDYAFSGCSVLNYITLPQRLTILGNCAFQVCSELTSIKIPDSVTSIGQQTFYNCSKLESILIGKGVKSIGYGAFGNCTALVEITIPDNVVTITNMAFSGCSNLSSATFKNPEGWKAGTTTIDAEVLENDKATAAKYLRSNYLNKIWTRS